MQGIKDSVEDVSAMFKRMANLKPQAATWSIFAETPTAEDSTVLVRQEVPDPLVEFTFGDPESVKGPGLSAQEPIPAPVQPVKPRTPRSRKAEISEDQLLLFKIA